MLVFDQDYLKMNVLTHVNKMTFKRNRYLTYYFYRMRFKVVLKYFHYSKSGNDETVC